MSLNYTSYVSQIANLLVISSGDANFQTMLPGMIDYAEQRIYRELDLLYTQVTDSTTSCSSGNRNFNMPTTIGTYVVVDNINVITPAATPASSGNRVQLMPVSREFIDIVYPYGGVITGVPQYWAMASNTEAIFGPVPDAAYVIEVVGVQRPQQLSSANSSTILTQYIPDVFIAASMVFGTGYERDFGAQADNPQMGASWEAQYKQLFQSADMEQARAKYQSQGWTSNKPAQYASKDR